MRVLYLANSGQIGGGNRSLQSLWGCLTTSGIEPLVVCPEGPMEELCRESKVSVAPIAAYPEIVGGRIAESLAGVLWWKRLLRRLRPDLIHTNDLLTGRSVSIASRLAGIPVICHMRFYASREFQRWVFRGIPKPQAIIYNSRAMFDMHAAVLSRLCPRAIQCVVYNGVSTMRFMPRWNGNAANRPRVGIVANLIPIKGHEDFLDMAALVKKQYPAVEFVIVGDDVQGSGFRAELEARSNALGLSECVRFLGHRSDVANILQTLEVLVCASHAEPFGRCLIEGMATGLPVVATRVGGIPEVVDEGVTGLLVEPGCPRQLAQSVDILLSDSVLRERMGIAGRERVERLFSDEAQAQGIRDVYRAVMPRGRGVSASLEIGQHWVM